MKRDVSDAVDSFSLTATFTLYYYVLFFILRFISKVSEATRPLLSLGIAGVALIIVPIIISSPSITGSPRRHASRTANPLAVILPPPPPAKIISNYLDDMLSSTRGGLLSSGRDDHLGAISDNQDFTVIPEAVSFQFTGKVLVLAEVHRKDTPDGYKRHKVDRLNADGTADLTFNVDKTCLTFDPDIDRAQLFVKPDDSFSLIIFHGVATYSFQTDNVAEKILVHHFDKDGRPLNRSEHAFFLEQFSKPGSWIYHVDTTNNNGTEWNIPDRKRVDFKSVQTKNGEEYPERIVSDDQGFIAFYRLNGSHPLRSPEEIYYLGIAYFDADGKKSRFDELTNLSTDQIADLELNWNFFSKIAIQTQHGKLFFVTTGKLTHEHITIMRFDEPGNLDTAFAENAYASLQQAKITEVNALAHRSDGSVLVAGYDNYDGRRSLVLLHPDGAIDPNFQIFTVIN